MKRIYILRHAKAVAKDAEDFDRVLAPRGHAQMKVISTWLAERSERPELALVSPAARARETWGLAGLPDVPVVFDARIYEASPKTLLDVIRGAEETARTLVLVGHNPGLEDLAHKLVGSGPAGLRARIETKFPTAAIVAVDLEVESWGAVTFGAGRLTDFVTPAMLGGEDD